MTLMEAAKKWDLSPNWVRELIRSKRVKSRLRTDVPVPYYEIPDGTPKPLSMQQAPRRKGSPKKPQRASIERRGQPRDVKKARTAKPKTKR